jgi:hypothetical protein
VTPDTRLYRTPFHPEGVDADQAIADLRRSIELHRATLDREAAASARKDRVIRWLRAELTRERECRLDLLERGR